MYQEIKKLDTTAEIPYEKNVDEKISLLPDTLWNRIRRKADFEKLNVQERAGLLKFITARIDIKNFGDEENEVRIISCSDPSAWIDHPAWFTNAQGKGVKVQSSEGKIELQIACIGNGELRINLRGRDCRDENQKRYPVWIDYTCFAVDGETIFSDTKTVWHDKGYVYRKAVKDGEVIRLEMTWSECQSSNVLDEFRQSQADLQNANSKLRAAEAALEKANNKMVAKYY